MLFGYCESPLGRLLLTRDERGLRGVSFPEDRYHIEPDQNWRRDDAAFGDVVQQLGAYFAGELREFHLDLDPDGTMFQRQVWQALRSIPYGVTTSYGELAEMLGKPTASRAVGAANGANPIPIIIPCHRVIGADGSLTGFGGGLPAKRWLLSHEAALPAADRQIELWAVE